MNKDRSGERMKLGAFFHPTGNHVAAWLHPDAQIDAGTNFRHYAEITQTAERGKFDLMRFAVTASTAFCFIPRICRVRSTVSSRS